MAIRQGQVILICSLLAWANAFAEEPAPPKYEVIDLGSFCAHAIDDEGVLYGATILGEKGSAPSLGMPAVWQDGEVKRLDVPDTTTRGCAKRAVDRRLIGGIVWLGSARQPIIWDKGRPVLVGQGLKAPHDKAVSALNAGGTVVSSRFEGLGIGFGGSPHAMFYRDGRILIEGRLDIPGAIAIYDLNSKDTGVGARLLTSEGSTARPVKPFVVRLAFSARAIRANHHDLPVESPYQGEALCINDDGLVVGWVEKGTAPPYTRCAALWRPEHGSYVLVNLGNAGRANARAVWVSSSGLIVGCAGPHQYAEIGEPVLFSERGATLLRERVEQRFAHQLGSPVAINRNGAVLVREAGTSHLRGARYLLVPKHVQEHGGGQAAPNPKTRPTPVPSGDPQEPPAPEERAQQKLQIARNYIAGGMKAKAAEVLAKLITDFPETGAAKEAQKLLDAARR